MKTILPHVARARLDSRLVPNQTPDGQLELIRKHLAAKGFADVGIRKISGYPPAQTSVEAPIVRTAISVFNKYGTSPGVAPRLAGSAPYYIFTDRLKLPMVMGALGHGTGAHAPDEYMVIEPKPGSRVAGLATVEKYYVDFLYAFAAQ
jgi:acetylornithine deacetylase/succinyl-diaminopimelate desuccinylase-like protein